MSRLERFAISYTAGVVTGAVIALLLAPMTGKKLQRKVSDVADRVIDAVENVQESMRKLANA